LTVDVIVENPEGKVALVKRKYPPPGWAIPGGFVELGEKTEAAAQREIMEEIGLQVTLVDILGVYSDPRRDPRFHTVSVVYLAAGNGPMRAADDAAEVAAFGEDELPEPLAFDHSRILADYFQFKRTGLRPIAVQGARR